MRGLSTFYYIALSLMKVVSQSSEMGAAPELRAATDPSVQKGDYYGAAAPPVTWLDFDFDRPCQPRRI